MADFVPGLELARAFYDEVVVSLLGDRQHSAALMGSGSDVLGFDTERSTDHGWGPPLKVFVAPRDVVAVRDAIDAGLPGEFRGWPTRFGWDDVPDTHHVEVAVLGPWLESRVGFGATRAISSRQWLCAPQQRLLEIVLAAVFHDPEGERGARRARLVPARRVALAGCLSVASPRPGGGVRRPGRRGRRRARVAHRRLAARSRPDAARLPARAPLRAVRQVARLAFARLAAAASLVPALLDVLAAEDYETREAALVIAVGELAARQNALGIAETVESTARLFHSRPYRVLGAGRFTDACAAHVNDPWLRAQPLVGGVDQLSDSTDVLEDPRVFARVAALFASVTA